jgi:hypothetical protein
LIREPVFVFGGTVEELRRTHPARRSARELVPAVYIEAMFRTTNDADNRAPSLPRPPMHSISSASGVHGPRKTIDKVTNS